MTPAEKFTAYTRWLRYIHDTHPELPKGIKRATLLAYCQAQARNGSYGIDCFASDTRIAEELEINHRDIIAAYRKFAIELGWFVPNGRKDRRVVGLNIAIPKDGKVVPNGPRDPIPAATKPADTESPAEPKHDAWIGPEDDDDVIAVCLGCEPLLGTHSFDELRVIHAEAIQSYQ